MEYIPIRKITVSAQEPIFSESFDIRDVDGLLAGNDMVQPLHRHDFFYILVLQKGMGTHQIDFTSYAICDYSVFCMRPGQVHCLTLKAGSTGYLLQFKANFYHTSDKETLLLLQKVCTPNLYHVDRHRFEKLFSVLAYLFQEFTERQERYEQVIKANLSVFFIELARQTDLVLSGNATTYAQERFDQFSELLQTDICTHKQVSYYADKLNLSVYQLNAITKTLSGKNCSELITDYIILESRRYLLATSSQVNQIAYQLGYEDVSYFIRFFKKHTGYSPETFRENFR